MDEIINARYNKKILFDSFTNSKTNNIMGSLNRKGSALTNYAQSLKKQKYLPKININRQKQRRINISTDFKITKPQRIDIFSSLKRQRHNFSKLTISYDSQEPIKKYVAVSKQGKRRYHEDRYICKVKNSHVYSHNSLKKQTYDLFAVFDGHGGATCAEYLQQNFPIILSRSKIFQSNPQQSLKETFQKCEQRFIDIAEAKETKETSGSCAVVCIVTPQKVITANLGDSRALMLSKEHVLELTKDHKPSDLGQKMRILKHGGKIYKQQEGLFKQIKLFHQLRIIPGNLNVSRTIGDIQVKLRKYGGLPGMISAIPDVRTYEKGQYDILLLASDGLFQAFTSENILQIYKQTLKQNQSLSKQRLLKLFIDSLCEEAEGKSSDNITVVASNLK